MDNGRAKTGREQKSMCCQSIKAKWISQPRHEQKRTKTESAMNYQLKL